MCEGALIVARMCVNQRAMDVLVGGAVARGLSLGISLCHRRFVCIDFSSLHGDSSVFVLHHAC